MKQGKWKKLYFTYIISKVRTCRKHYKWKTANFQMLLKVGCFFLAQKFVLSIIVCIFAAREPAKPLNDAQMCGSFFIIRLFSKYANVKITASFFSRLSRSHRFISIFFWCLYISVTFIRCKSPHWTGVGDLHQMKVTTLYVLIISML